MFLTVELLTTFQLQLKNIARDMIMPLWRVQVGRFTLKAKQMPIRTLLQ